MFREVGYSFYSGKFLEQLPRGVFLNTRNGGVTNTMTIDWGSIGIMWGRPVFTALLRPSGFSSGLIEKTGEFTVSIPVDNDFSDELALCAQISGKSADKFGECNLTAMNSQTLETFIVGDCELHLDCKVIMKTGMNLDGLPEKLAIEDYEQVDMHDFYYAEIVSAYVIE